MNIMGSIMPEYVNPEFVRKVMIGMVLTFKLAISVASLCGRQMIESLYHKGTCPVAHLVRRGVFPLNRARCMHRYLSCIGWICSVGCGFVGCGRCRWGLVWDVGLVICVCTHASLGCSLVSPPVR